MIRAWCLLAVLAVAAPASAQSFTFERTLPVAAASALDVLTERGKIEIISGDAGRILVQGTVRVRAAWNTPANAPELAKAFADHPSIEPVGSTVRLRPPNDRATRNAVTVSYQIRVPRATSVAAVSDSG